MNKDAIAYLATALISAGVGAAIAWYVAKEKYDRETREQIIEVKNYYAQHRTEVSSDEQVETEESPEEEEVFPDREEYRKHLELYGQQKIEADHPDDMPATPYHQKFVPPELEDIFVIPKDVYYSDEDDYEKQSLVWYAGDDVMVDFYENVMTDYPMTVGDEFNDKFVKDGQTRNAWVRNTKLETDYEIELQEGDYTEIVLGFTHEEDHPPLRFRDED